MDRRPFVFAFSQPTEDHLMGSAANELNREVRDLLRRHRFLPRGKDKLTADLVVGAAMDGAITLSLRLVRVADAEGALEARIEQTIEVPAGLGQRVPGGGVQNAVVDLSLLAAALTASGIDSPGVVVASPGDPFAGLPGALAESCRRAATVLRLEVPRRIAVHLPISDDGRETLVVTTPAIPCAGAIDALLSRNPIAREHAAGAVAFLSPEVLRGAAFEGRVQVLSPPTATKAQVLAESRDVARIYPVNRPEALELVRAGLELRSPIERGALDPAAMARLERELRAVREAFGTPARPPHPIELSVSLGRDGGLFAGTTAAGPLACVSTIPEKPEAIDELVDESLVFSPASDVGCGDSLLAVLVLANTGVLRPVLSAMIARLGGAPHCVDAASLFAASALGRILSALILRTGATWPPVTIPTLGRLVRDVLQASAVAMRGTRSPIGPEPLECQLAPWGIRAVIWRPSWA